MTVRIPRWPPIPVAPPPLDAETLYPGLFGRPPLITPAPAPLSVVTTGPGLAWATSTAYALNQLVTNAGQTYICNTAHTSGSTFAGETANWTAIGGVGGASAAAPLSLITDFGLNPASSAAVNTPLIQSAINAAIAAGRALSLDYKNWNINATLTINGNLKIVGPSHQESWGPYLNLNTINFPTGSPPFTGGTITQTAANVNAFTIANTTAGIQVDLDDFGIIMAPGGTPFATTGHGIQVIPPTSGGKLDNGLMNSAWRNVSVYGHDGNHYAFEIYNGIYCKLEHLRGYGGGFLHFAQNTINTFYGNSTFIDCYGFTLIAGTAHCWLLETVSGSSNYLDYCVLVRPQGWVGAPSPAIAGTTPPSGGTQLCFKALGAMSAIEIYAPDWEATAGNTATPVYPTGLGCFWSAVGGAQSSGAAMSAPPVSGTPIVNSTGTHQMYFVEFVMNPTGGAAADAIAELGNQFGGSFYRQGNVHLPAGGLAGTVMTLNVLVQSGASVRFTFTNCTVQNSGNWPIASIGTYF